MCVYLYNNMYHVCIYLIIYIYICNVCTERGRRLSESGFQVTHHMTQHYFNVLSS